MDLVRKVYLTQQEMLKFMKGKRQDSLSPNVGKYYEARQEINDSLEKDNVPEVMKATIYAQRLQRMNQLENQVFRPEPSPVQMITQTEQTKTSESDSVTPFRNLQADYRFCSENDAKSCKITDSETKGSFRRHQLER